MSSKTARGENSRQKILEITRRLIGESDSHSVSLDQIAKGVSTFKKQYSLAFRQCSTAL